MLIDFVKMEGTKNDYIYIDAINQNIQPNVEEIVRLSDRKTGIGSDGVIYIMSSKIADFKMRMFNLDGSEGKMCGNGIRCFSKFCFDQGLTNKKVLRIETLSGVREVELLFDKEKVVGARVDMGKPILETKKIPMIFDKEQVINEKVIFLDKFYNITALSMGNPHVVTLCENIDEIDIETIGPEFEHSSLFPESVNTEFVEIVSRNYIKMRVWERGSNETKSCGTGACASMYACYLNGLVDDKVEVELLGGNLMIEYENNHIIMSGSANIEFEGKVEYNV